ncbi:hypothetical protein B0T16DRAFT_177178 [Cercophora newfieldiana]|uniref:Secreted protein n=1 Tax=Cercophora newfieldiana TaxID=92897 RepID=A0AA39Y223_9PEZI|nr:hypothetical protein B0T16DRAFT_177178 [Cercophora newfieldiana]
MVRNSSFPFLSVSCLPAPLFASTLQTPPPRGVGDCRDSHQDGNTNERAACGRPHEAIGEANHAAVRTTCVDRFASCSHCASVARWGHWLDTVPYAELEV